LVSANAVATIGTHRRLNATICVPRRIFFVSRRRKTNCPFVSKDVILFQKNMIYKEKYFISISYDKACFLLMISLELVGVRLLVPLALRERHWELFFMLRNASTGFAKAQRR
jgi:hypothetical protein